MATVTPNAIMNLPQGMGLGTFKVATGTGSATAAGTVSVTTGLNTLLGFSVTPEGSTTLTVATSGANLSVDVTSTGGGTFSWIAIGY